MQFPNLKYGIGSTSYKNYHTTKQNRYMYMEGVKFVLSVSYFKPFYSSIALSNNMQLNK